MTEHRRLSGGQSRSGGIPTRKLEAYRYADIDALASVWTSLIAPERIEIAAQQNTQQIWLPSGGEIDIRRVEMVVAAGAIVRIFALNTAARYGRYELDVTTWGWIHLVLGVAMTCLACFSHLLVLFYLIGTEGDVKEALEPHPDLAPRFVPEVKAFKMRVFPAACLAVLLTITAAMMGAEVHSRLLLRAPPSAPPALRDVPFWWSHAAMVIVALGANVIAFRREIPTVRANRRTIESINLLLAERRSGSPADG